MSKYIIAIILLGLVACTNSAKEVTKDIEASQKANSEAAGQLEWDSSDSHPEQLFARWRKDKSLSAEVCKGLTAKDSEALTLFEEEIKKPENQELIKNCKAELEAKLEQYWKTEREKVQK